MLKLIDETQLGYFEHDPVRPHIDHYFRITENRKAFALWYNDEKPAAIICCAFCEDVPADEDELDLAGTVAVFYTVWSYERGAGAEIVFDAVDWIKANKPEIDRFVTLSPPTEMARKFHLRNGAEELRINPNTVNFEYKNV